MRVERIGGAREEGRVHHEDRSEPAPIDEVIQANARASSNGPWMLVAPGKRSVICT
jgi:hypothetical protein